jgi:hypothetical protein
MVKMCDNKKNFKIYGHAFGVISKNWFKMQSKSIAFKISFVVIRGYLYFPHLPNLWPFVVIRTTNEVIPAG